MTDAYRLRRIADILAGHHYADFPGILRAIADRVEAREAVVARLAAAWEGGAQQAGEMAGELARLARVEAAAFEAIEAEPEYPGRMPPELETRFRRAMHFKDMLFFEENLRIAVRMTKKRIRDRLKATLDAGEGS